MTGVDLFAGLGGWSTGAEAAGCRVLWAANHWQTAVDWHKRNHPETETTCCDLRIADWTRVPRPDLLLASPSCVGHTPARGRERPHHDAHRATAWVVVEALEQLRPDWFAVENVVQMRRWELYDVWRLALTRLGYVAEEHVLDAADFGAPAQRERLFVVGRRGLRPPRLDVHPAERRGIAADAIDLDAYPWSPLDVPGRSPRTLAQADEARRRGLDVAILPYYGSCRRGAVPVVHGLDRPLGTITTVERFGLVRGPEMRMLAAEEYRAAMGFPSSTLLPARKADAVHLLGNAVSPPVARAVVEAIQRAA